ncbi:MAG: ABC transporter ATP-binding protein [Candidatus Eremiobacteraeota bacterium]|nr:ABC transporter ATP-binding protein [Candidatus Eremiobacteraeota bacterium]
MIELRDVSVRIGDRLLLAGLNGQFAPGELVAVLGRNGVGKTTFLRAIAGLHPTAGGRIALAGTNVTALTPTQRALRVGFVTSDEVLLDALRVRDVVAIGRFPHHRWWQWNEQVDDDTAIDAALDAVGIKAFAQRLFSTLSSGERQRVWLALGLAQATPVLLLDEPTSHLDLRVAHEILALLRVLARNGKTVVCVLHDLNDAAAYADRIVLLSDGTMLCAEEPDAVLSSDLPERAYGVAMERVRLPNGRLRVFGAPSP